MSTRAAVAAKIRLVRQRLETILFHHPTNNHHAVTNNDNNKNKIIPKTKKIVSYSYNELKMAYLKRIQDLHPDKYYHHTTTTTTQQPPQTSKSTNNMKQQSQTNPSLNKNKCLLENEIEFRELQEAWTNYDTIMKQSKKINCGNLLESNFTMFGVGCSFSDNPQERQYRTEIMDQAGRGWFSAGSIPQQTTTTTTDKQQQQKSFKQIRLTDDELFTIDSSSLSSSSSSTDKQQTLKTRPKSLIDHMIKSQKKPPKTTS